MRLPRLDLRGIPAKVLRGSVRGYKSVGTTYRSIFFQEFMRQVHNAYLEKSEGGSDDLGNTWKPLKEKTIKAKRYRYPQNAEKINIRTEKLLNATKPGRVSNNRYYSPRNQEVSFNPLSISFSIDLPYFEDVQKVRPLLPKNYQPWVVAAHERAIGPARAEYDKIRNARKNRNTNRRR